MQNILKSTNFDKWINKVRFYLKNKFVLTLVKKDSNQIRVGPRAWKNHFLRDKILSMFTYNII